jgi:hypothetical protein
MRGALLCSLTALLVSTVSVDAAAPPARTPLVQRQTVDLELVIMTDASGSIDRREAALQRQGIAAAFRSAEVVRAIQNGTMGRIAVAYVDWAAEYYNTVVVDWTIISDKASADAFAGKLLATPLNFFDGTAIGGAMYFGAELIGSNAIEGTRRTIDISGDGPDNQGTQPSIARTEIVARGITINGLPIVTNQYGGGEWGAYYGDLFNFYRSCVIAGRGSFAIAAQGFDDFANAVRRKLVLEISDLTPVEPQSARVMRAAAPQPRALTPPAQDTDRANCLGGYF